MKYLAPILLLVIVAGCGSTPTQVYDQQQIVFTAAVETMITLRETGKLDDETFKYVKDLANICDDYLDRMESAAIAGDKTSFRIYLGFFKDTLYKLQAYNRKTGGDE